MTAKPSGMHNMGDADHAAKAVKKAVGDISGIIIAPTEILTGTYVRPEKTAGGLYLAESTRREDEYQGKVSLVLAVGAAAFEDDPATNTSFHGFKPKVGDWVICRVAYGFMMNINKHPCRVILDKHVSGIIPRPDLVY